MEVESKSRAFELRRQLLLRSTAKTMASAEPLKDTYGNSAIAGLALGLDPAVPNAVLRYVSEWFDHPHPLGRDHRGECDFAAMKLCRAFYLYQNTALLEPDTLRRIQRFFLSRDFQSMYDSENHHFLFHTSRYLMGSTWPDETFEAYAKTGRELAAIDEQWLDTFIRFRARRGWGEFASSCYIIPDVECLLNLYDFAPSAELRRLSEMMITQRLADMAVDSLNGMYCGAHGRIYQPHALDHRDEPSLPLQYLYFGRLPEAWLRGNGLLVDALTSPYRPPELLLELANQRSEAYENLTRAHLHNTSDVLPSDPLEGSIRKYTYWTPDYVLGCVQLQDPYPPDCPGRWYTHHEQHEWDLSIAGCPDARIFTHHPGSSGNEHGYWTGDLNCGCGHFMQVRSVLLGLYDIPAHEPYQLIHAYLPREAFDEIVEAPGLVAVRKGSVYIALRLLGGHARTTSGDFRDREIISAGPRNGVVCEVGMQPDYGSLQAFAVEMAGNEIAFDPASMVLAYTSRRMGTFRMDTRGLRVWNGQALDLAYPTYASPYLESAWDSGLVQMKVGDQHLQLDFRKTSSE